VRIERRKLTLSFKEIVRGKAVGEEVRLKTARECAHLKRETSRSTRLQEPPRNDRQARGGLGGKWGAYGLPAAVQEERQECSVMGKQAGEFMAPCSSARNKGLTPLGKGRRNYAGDSAGLEAGAGFRAKTPCSRNSVK